MFPMTVTINDSIQLNAVMAALQSGSQIAATTPAAAVAADVKTTKPASTKKEAAKQEAAAEAPVETPNPEEAATSYVYQDAADAITKLAKAKGREGALAVLQKFDIAKLPDAKPEQFAGIIAAAEKAIAGE
jgi:hypothetical protein